MSREESDGEKTFFMSLIPWGIGQLTNCFVRLTHCFAGCSCIDGTDPGSMHASVNTECKGNTSVSSPTVHLVLGNIGNPLNKGCQRHLTFLGNLDSTPIMAP